MNIHKDVIIIGGGLSGLVAANFLSHLGINCLLLERNKKLGGGNVSVTDALGNLFDMGYHALDCERNRITERFFKRVTQGNFYEHELTRGIVLRNYLFPYNTPLDHWPGELQAMFSKPLDVDDIRGDLTFDKISAVYGKKFVTFAIEEILNSYPSKQWALAQGANFQDHFGMIYPWFFPRLKKNIQRDKEWDNYHDRMRVRPQKVIYPASGGFEGFSQGIISDIDRRYCEIRTGQSDIKFNFESGCFELQEIVCGADNYTADLYLWCAPPPLLMKLLSIPFNAGVPQTIVLGNFVFEQELSCNYMEILVGSLEHRINRIGFPGLLAKSKNNRVQVEFYFPVNTFSETEEQWRDSWLKSLQQLAIVSTNNRILNYQFVSEIRGAALVESFDVITDKFSSQLQAVETNIKVPYFNLGPENINRVVPGVIDGTLKQMKMLS